MMLLSPATTWAKVGDTFDDDVLSYSITNEVNKEVTVWAYLGEGPTGGLEIPTTVTNTNNDQEYSVTGISVNALRDCSGLKSVNLPTSVEAIGEMVFMGCSSLKSINLPANLTIIGAGAFYECTGLSSISFPDKLAYIQSAAFADCTGLTSISIPASVQVIKNDVFLGCTNITDVYCYADPAKLEWTDGDYNDFKADKATVCHVDKDKLADFKAKWSTGNSSTDINVTFERIYQKNDLSFEKDVVDTYYGTTDFEPALTNPHSLTVTYSSSDEKVATVNAETGKVNIQKVGQAVITATFADKNTDYKPGTVSYTLNVKAKTVKNPPYFIVPFPS